MKLSDTRASMMDGYMVGRMVDGWVAANLDFRLLLHCIPDACMNRQY